jgi:NTE family protein
MFRYNEPQVDKIDSFVQYLKALVRTILESQNNSHLNDDDWQRTIYIDTLGVSTTDFGLTSEKKQLLEDSGIKCTEAYFDWYDSPSSQPINRP